MGIRRWLLIIFAGLINIAALGLRVLGPQMRIFKSTYGHILL